MKMPSVRHGFITAMKLCCAVFSLTACESAWVETRENWQSGDPEHAMVAATDPIALRIAESADKAATALQDLARVEQTRRPPAPEPPAIAAPNELYTPVTIDWVGAAEPLIRNIADRLKYDVVVVGSVPTVPVVVQIHQRDRAVLEALRNIGDQATQFMDLVVDPRNQKIEIRYLRPEPTQS